MLEIIVPYFNRDKSLKSTLLSLNDQEAKNFNVTIVDDGSLVPLVVDAETYSYHIQVYRQSNQGVAAARNAGVKHSTGSFLVFLDAGDLLDPLFTSRLEQLILSPNACDSRMWATAFTTIEPGKEVCSRRPHTKGAVKEISYQRYLERVIAGEQLLHICSCCFRREAFFAVGGFQGGATHGEDHEFLLKVMRIEKKFHYLDEPLFLYVIDENESVTRAPSATPVYAHTRYLQGLISRSEQEEQYLITTVIDNFIVNVKKGCWAAALSNAAPFICPKNLKNIISMIAKRMVVYAKRHGFTRRDNSRKS